MREDRALIASFGPSPRLRRRFRMHMKLFHYINVYSGGAGLRIPAWARAMRAVARSNDEYRARLRAGVVRATHIGALSDLASAGAGDVASIAIWYNSSSIREVCEWFSIWPPSDAAGLRSANGDVVEFWWNQTRVTLLSAHGPWGGLRPASVQAVEIPSPALSLVRHRELESRYQESGRVVSSVRGRIRPDVPRVIHLVSDAVGAGVGEGEAAARACEALNPS